MSNIPALSHRDEEAVEAAWGLPAISVRGVEDALDRVQEVLRQQAGRIELDWEQALDRAFAREKEAA
jgi:hypothetical protein